MAKELDPPPPSSAPSSVRSGFEGKLLAALIAHVSAPSAHAIVSLCAATAKVPTNRLDLSHLPLIVTCVERAIGLFGLAREQREACMRAIKALGPDQRAPSATDTGRQPVVQQPVAARTQAITIARENDIVNARLSAREAARAAGMSEVAETQIVTAVSELSRNIYRYAGHGTIELRTLMTPPGIEVIARDEGPGIPDVAAILSPAFRSRTGMGVGLRGTRRIVDFFDVKTTIGEGTTVVVRKYR